MACKRAAAGLPHMYRLIFWVVLWVGVASGAPQDADGALDQTQPLVLDGRANVTGTEVGFAGAALVPASVAPAVPASAASAPTSAAQSNDDDFVRRARQNDFTTEPDDPETTDTTEPATETERITSPRISSPARTFSRRPRPTQPSPRFISKLSYFDKSSDSGGVSTNLVDNLGKDGRRKFKSHCRCEKIWNCPKLQITVPRCPDEYFLCCFPIEI